MFSGHRRKWSETEINALIRAFSGYRRPPNFQECRNMQDIIPSLRQRSLAQIKSRAWALVGLSHGSTSADC